MQQQAHLYQGKIIITDTKMPQGKLLNVTMLTFFPIVLHTSVGDCVVYSCREMSEMPEDMPAYLNDEPVSTGIRLVVAVQLSVYCPQCVQRFTDPVRRKTRGGVMWKNSFVGLSVSAVILFR